MNKLITLLVFVAIIGIGAYWAADHHVVKTNKGVIVLVKRYLTYADTHVDVRKWSSADFDAHPELKRAMIEQGYRDMLAEIKEREIRAKMDEMRGKVSDVADEFAAKVQKTIDIWLGETPPAATQQPDTGAKEAPAQQ
ncbi:MAG: hypothetical protein AB1724_12835 [Thermodesulfobacteriota bacterium]